MYEENTVEVDDNTRAGFYYSVALHFSVAIAAGLFAYVGILFSPEEIKNEEPFEMVEPPAPLAPSQNTDTPDTPTEDMSDDIEPIEVSEIAPIKPIEKIKEPEPEPEPEPKPSPNPEPKPVVKPKPKTPPKTISIDDFRKTNPEKKTKTRRSNKTQKPIVAPKIGSGKRNIDSVKYSQYEIDGLVGNSTQMVDALAAYKSYITKTARRNWVMPDASPNGMKAVVSFTVSKDGRVSNARIVKSSGLQPFDSSALLAISTLSLVPPPDKVSHEVRVEFVAE